MAYQEVYGGIYNSPSDFLQSPYDVIIPPMFDGTTPISDVHDSLPNRASLFLDPTFLANFIADSSTQTTVLWQALLDNDNYDWKPNNPMKLFYCEGDQTVKPQNTIDAYDAMVANGTPHIFQENLGSLSHTGCVIPAISAAIDYFQSIRQSCNTPMGISSPHNSNITFSMYPSPSNEWVNIIPSFVNDGVISIYSINGTKIINKPITKEMVLNVSDWAEGVYLIKITSEYSFASKKLIIKH